MRLVEGQLVVGEVAGQILGEAEARRVGIGGVLAVAPVGGPERAQQRLRAAAAGEPQGPAGERKQQAAARALFDRYLLRPGSATWGGTSGSPQSSEAIQGLRKAAVESVRVAELVENGGRESVSSRPRLSTRAPLHRRAGNGSSSTRDPAAGQFRPGAPQEPQSVIDPERLLGAGATGAEATRPEPAATGEQQRQQGPDQRGESDEPGSWPALSPRGRSPPRSRRAAKRGASGRWLPASPPRGRSVRKATGR